MTGRPASVRLRYAAAVLTVLLWSTATLTSGVISGRYSLLGTNNSITQRELPAFVFWIVTFGFFALLLVVLRERCQFAQELRATSMRTRWHLLLLGGLIPAYMLAYYYGLLFSPPLNAYVIIYLWPIFHFLLSHLQRDEPRGIAVKEVLMLVLAFLGAALVVQESKGAAFAREHLPGYAASLAAALLIAATFITLSRAVLRSDESTGTAGKLSRNHYAYCIACFIGSLLLGILVLVRGSGIGLARAEVMACLWLGVVVFAAAHLCWTYAIRPGDPDSNQELSGLTALVYLTPVVSAFILYVGFGERVTTYTVLGIALVILGNLTVQSRYRYVNAAVGASAFSLVVGVFCNFAGTLQLDDNLSTISSLLGTVFAIVVSFSLTRLAQFRERETALLWKLGAAFDPVWRAADATDEPRRQRVQKEVDRFMRWVVDLDFGLRRGSRYNTVLRMKEVTTETRTAIAAALTPRDGRDEALGSSLRQVERCMEEWLEAKFSSIHLAELAANWLLGVLTVICLILFRGDSLLGDVFATFASPVVIFLLLAVRDYSSGRLERDLHSTLLLQRRFRPDGPELYIPRPILASQNLRAPGETIRVRSSAGVCDHAVDDEIRVTDIEQVNWAWTAAVWSGVLFAVAVLIALLAQKHGLL